MSNLTYKRFTRSNSVMDSSNDELSDTSMDRSNTDKKKIPRRNDINLERFVTSLTRTSTRSAHGIKMVTSEKPHQQENGDSHIDRENVKSYNSLEDLFNGTERQVLYRINMLIHQHDIDLNEHLKDENDRVCLHYAVKKQFVTVAEKLVDNKANILQRDKFQKTPLHYAIAYEPPEERAKERKKIRHTCSCCGSVNKKRKKKENKKREAQQKEEENNFNAKCDAMAAFLISKIVPFRVRELFGDKTDLKHFIKLEQLEDKERKSEDNGNENVIEPTGSPDNGTSSNQEIINTRYRGQDAPNSRSEQTSEPGTSGYMEIVGDTGENITHSTAPERPAAESKTESEEKPFKFIDIVMDPYLQQTVLTILDKTEDTDPIKNKPRVYISILEGTEGTTSHGTKDADNVKLKNEDQECAFHYIAKNSHETTRHPAVRALVQYKWKKWAFRRYLVNAITFGISFVALTIISVVGAQSDSVFIYDSPWQYTRGALEILICLFVLRSLISELIQLKSHPLDYVKSLMNWLELSSVLFLVITVILRYTAINAHWYTFAVGYVLWTTKGLKYAAVTRHTAAYSETLRAIMMRDVWLFALFFIVIEMVFGGTLLLALKATDTMEKFPETATILRIYYLGLRTMIEGGMDNDVAYKEYPVVVQLVIIVFMSMTIVIMLNILIAQLSNTYETAYAEGQIKSWVSRAEVIVSFEKNRFSFCGMKARNKRKYKLNYDKENLLEEKEKMEEMRSTLKKLDGNLLHADLTVQTVKTRLNVLLHALHSDKGSPRDNEKEHVPTDETGSWKPKTKELFEEIGHVKNQQSVLMNDIGEIKSLLRRMSIQQVTALVQDESIL